MSELPKRIHGTELEYGVTQSRINPITNSREVSRDTLNAALLKYADTLPHLGSARLTSPSTNNILGNGARLYIDTGDHAEYATPEDDSFIGTVANEIVGEQHMRRVTEGVEGVSCTPNKRTIDEKGTTWGCHENYFVDGTNGLKTTLEDLALFGVYAAARSVFCGAGALCGGRYTIAQKAGSFKEDFGTVSTGPNKAFIHQRDEPHSKREDWFRLHVITGDPLMSPWATRMKFGTASLVIRLLEHGQTLPELRFASPIHEAARQIAADSTMTDRYKLQRGASVDALDINQQLVTAVQQLAKEVSLPDEELWSLEEWDKACAILRQDPRLYKHRIDWVMKQHLLEQQHERHGYAWTDPKMSGLDLLWGEISPRGIGLKLRETSFSDDMPDASLLKERFDNAPSTTRANIRGKFVKAFSGQTDRASADWMWVEHDPTPRIELSDPHDNYDERVEDLLRKHAA